MQIQTTGKNIDIGTAFQTHVEDRLTDGINKYFNGATSAHVFVEKERAQFITEIVVHLPTGLVLQARGNGGDAYSSFEEALDHIEKRLRRYKRRLVTHARQRQKPVETVPAQSFVIAPPAEEEEEAAPAEAGEGEEDFVPTIVAETTEQVPVMTVGEAVMQLELAERDVLLFRNVRHGGVNVVYRRRDGHIGWVDPGPCPQEGRA